MFEQLQEEAKIREVISWTQLVDEMEKLPPADNDEELGELIVSFQNKIAEMLALISHNQC